MGDSRYERLTDDEAAAQAPEPWTVVDGELTATFETGSMVKGLEFVTAVVDAAESANHHPDIDFTYPRVRLSVSTHEVRQLTDADVALARAVSAIADDLLQNSR
ncbi:MAG: 4a-hydroxytetrahydrobiopterin dehydratase [Gordonia sp. (in: high G+C Gram-positive bacteria)]